MGFQLYHREGGSFVERHFPTAKKAFDKLFGKEVSQSSLSVIRAKQTDEPTFLQLIGRAVKVGRTNRFHAEMVEDIRKAVVNQKMEPLKVRMANINPKDSTAIMHRIDANREQLLLEMAESGKIANDPLYAKIIRGAAKEKLLAIAALQSDLPFLADEHFECYLKSSPAALSFRLMTYNFPVRLAAIAASTSVLYGIFESPAAGAVLFLKSLAFAGFYGYLKFRKGLKERAEIRKRSVPDYFARGLIADIVDAPVSLPDQEDQPLLDAPARTK